MTIRQEDETPIGNHFHDTGILKVMESIQNIVDEFEVDTDQLNAYIDSEIDKLKSLKSQVKKVEQAWIKKIHNREINDSINTGAY